MGGREENEGGGGAPVRKILNMQGERQEGEAAPRAVSCTTLTNARRRCTPDQYVGWGRARKVLAVHMGGAGRVRPPRRPHAGGGVRAERRGRARRDPGGDGPVPCGEPARGHSV